MITLFPLFPSQVSDEDMLEREREALQKRPTEQISKKLGQWREKKADERSKEQRESCILCD